MYTTSLRKVGGSVMLTVPRVFLDALHLDAGAKVNMDVCDGHLLVEPQNRRYTLDELLAQCDASADLSPEDREWLSSEPFGKEIL